jgi:hypothetical protein
MCFAMQSPARKQVSPEISCSMVHYTLVRALARSAMFPLPVTSFTDCGGNVKPANSGSNWVTRRKFSHRIV